MSITSNPGAATPQSLHRLYKNQAAATANPAAERTDEAKWDVTAPRGANIRQVPIRTDEGTWMDVDVCGRMWMCLDGVDVCAYCRGSSGGGLPPPKEGRAMTIIIPLASGHH